MKKRDSVLFVAVSFVMLCKRLRNKRNRTKKKTRQVITTKLGNDMGEVDIQGVRKPTDTFQVQFFTEHGKYFGNT